MKFLYKSSKPDDSYYVRELIFIYNRFLLFSSVLFFLYTLIEYFFNYKNFHNNKFTFSYFLILTIVCILLIWSRLKLNLFFATSLIIINILLLNYQISFTPQISFTSFYIITIFFIFFYYDFKQLFYIVGLTSFVTISYILSFLSGDFSTNKISVSYFISVSCISIIYIISLTYNIYCKFKLIERLKLPSNTSVSLSDVLTLAKNDDSKFFLLFCELYPNFIEALNKKYKNLSINEQKFCAMLYLKFSTKEIANYTNISIRSVQTKKYNLRKKLNNKNIDLYVFIEKICT